MARSTSGESVLQRVVRILHQFTPETPELTVSTLSRRAGLPIATTYRLVGEMVRYGLLERTEDRSVRMGLHLWEMSQRSSPVRDLREAAMPFMEDLHAAVRQHVSLGVLDGTDVLYLERLSAPEAAIGNLTRIAGRLPAYAVSCGIVLLAFAALEVREQVLSVPLEPLTDRTITDPDRLRATFAQVRRTGYAVAPGYIEPHATGVAMPIRDAGGTVIAGVSLTVPLDLSPQRLIPILHTTTRAISRAMGARERLGPDEVVRFRGA